MDSLFGYTKPQPTVTFTDQAGFYARQHICCSAYMISPIRPSICQTDGS